jgi:hypothetical protein
VANVTDLASVRQVLQKHREQVIRDYHAVGVGVGAKNGSSGEYAIVVYLKSERDFPSQPVTLDGVSLKFVVTGEFRAHSAKEK